MEERGVAITNGKTTRYQNNFMTLCLFFCSFHRSICLIYCIMPLVSRSISHYFIVKKLDQSHPGKKANICLPLASIQPFSLFHCQTQGSFRIQDSPRMIVAGQEDQVNSQPLRDICPYSVGSDLTPWSHPAVHKFTEVIGWCQHLITLSCKKRAQKSPSLKSEPSLYWHLKRQLFLECEQEGTVSFTQSKLAEVAR